MYVYNELDSTDVHALNLTALKQSAICSYVSRTEWE